MTPSPTKPDVAISDVGITGSKGGKVAVVTGAGRGIGRACAVRLSEAGYRVLAISRTKGELEETARLAARAEEIEALVGDVTESALATRAVERVMSRWERVDLLVNCAGVAPLRPIGETSVELFNQVIGINLTSAFAFARAVWEPMRQRKSGAIVSISSMASRDPFPGFSAYAAAKGGINALTLALDREGQPHGIRAYAVAPGAVETAMFRLLMSPEQFPTDKALDPREVAEVVYQCAEGALAYSSGETLFLSRR